MPPHPPSRRARSNSRARADRSGRGAASNPANRFEDIHLADLPAEIGSGEAAEDDRPRPGTRFRRDPSRSVVAKNDSPDVGFDRSVNPYRGCEHGCVYCYARPTHEYLGLSAGLDFETQIFVKEGAPGLLRKALAAPRWTPQVVALSGVTDPYQPVERRLGITRACLEVLLEFRNPVTIITKNRGVARDIDLLAKLSHYEAASVAVSVTTLDASLQRAMEPRASRPDLRLEAIRALRDAGVPVGVMVGPVLPGLTDHELPDILAHAAQAGASFAGYTLLRLPHAVKTLFVEWLERAVPERRDKVLHRIESLRGGRLNDPRFRVRHRGVGQYAEQIGQLFSLGAKRAGLSLERPPLSVDAFRRPGELFSSSEIGSTLRPRAR